MERGSAVYIMANKRNGTLYAGVTSNLKKEHGSIATIHFLTVLLQNITVISGFIIVVLPK